MVQTDFAEFVDDHEGIAQGRLMHQMIEQRGFSAAEKAG